MQDRAKRIRRLELEIEHLERQLDNASSAFFHAAEIRGVEEQLSACQRELESLRQQEQREQHA